MIISIRNLGILMILFGMDIALYLLAKVSSGRMTTKLTPTEWGEYFNYPAPE